MAFELLPLPYDSEALAPAISAETLKFHHGKHHQAYIDKTNAAIAGTDLADRIDESFGSLDALGKQLAERGAGHFASGWVWLAAKGDMLSIEETHDGDTLADSGFTPLLTIDVWEHAYYLDHQNKRPDYLKAVIDRHLNWDFAAENLARGATWKYPAPAYAE